MAKKSSCKPQKCTSASLLSGCIHRYLSKVIISLPTKPEIVDVFEKTLLGGFSCVNTRLAFDTSILLPRNQNGDRKKDVKLIYRIRNRENNSYEDKRVVEKILKMAQPLRTGYIKKSKKLPTLKEFNLIIKGISHEDKIVHLFVVDIEFDKKNATLKHFLFNEIYTLAHI